MFITQQNIEDHRKDLDAEGAAIDRLVEQAVSTKSWGDIPTLEQRTNDLAAARAEIAKAEAEFASKAAGMAQFADLLDMSDPGYDVQAKADGGVLDPEAIGTGRQLAPLTIGKSAMDRLFKAVKDDERVKVKSDPNLSFNTAGSLLPPGLHPNVLGPFHEGRLLDRLPVRAIGTSKYQYVRALTTTGSPSVVAEGALKPEVEFPADEVTAVVAKIAAHTGISYELMSDFPVFAQFVRQELIRRIIDVENQQLLNGDGATNADGSVNITGLLNTTGILTHARATHERSIDSVDIAIAAMRTGSVLTEPNLLVLHPNTWSIMRRTTDSQGRYLVNNDPTQGGGSTLWGVPILVTTVIAAGTGALLDTSKFGNVLLRESMSVQTGYAGNDYTHNISRIVAEERLTLAVEYPTAVLKLTNLGTDASDSA